MPDQMSRLTWALGYTRDRRAVPTLLSLASEAKLGDLKMMRAVIVSLGRIGDKAAAPALAGILTNPDRKIKEPIIRDLIAAVALYRCGDRNGVAKQTLEKFAQHPNGTWAELAVQTLRSKPGEKPAEK
jgi:HEAT repeat protein